ncbi:hypothetical protein LOD99_8699 [Oopsacas minuta]|uniref:EGF-like domain-containing protein n=1 Tax=Oopsacas minuta TaxID=111878 RepID=A0AAV7JFH2_9METZ|nr:hypothetical protein LOD99_8699 [Oopsacas minuta]
MKYIVPLFAVLIVFALRSEAYCTLSCTSEEIATNTPHCFITSIVSGTSCVVTGSESLVQRIEKVYLTVDISSTLTAVTVQNQVAPGKLEIVFSREYENIRTLTLHGDWIRITADSLRNLPNLEYFTFISGIFDVFPPFTNYHPLLTELILHNFTTDDPFSTIPSDKVSDLPQLQNLRLCPAKIVQISHVGISLLPSLETIIICNVTNSETAFQNACPSFNNLNAISIHEGGLQDISFLDCLPNPEIFEHLNLDFNQITSIDGLHRFPNLLLLGLFENRISSIRRSNFTGLGQLTFLNLPGNLIDVIWDDTFLDLISLKKLNLDVNPMVTINPRVIESIPNLEYFKTPLLHCDCSLEWLSIAYHTHNLHINPYSLCDTPSQFAGLNVYDPSIYVECSNANSPYECFSKTRETCNDGSYCQSTPEGFECICEGENNVYSRMNGGKCFNIDEVLAKPAECDGTLHLNADNELECGSPNKVPFP